MANALGTHQKGSLNIELNIVPFIDLMSCLTAFLLVTAVWVNTANLRNEVAGRGNDKRDDQPPRLEMLVEYDQITVTAWPSGGIRQVGAADWDRVALALHDVNPEGGTERPHVEIAAASSPAHPIAYQTLIAAMDTAIKAGFPDVGVTDPSSLGR